VDFFEGLPDGQPFFAGAMGLFEGGKRIALK
jgi:hypothetical protein